MNIEILTLIEATKKESTVLNDLTEKDIEKVCKKASASFSPFLSESEINCCILNALWKSIKKFNPDKNTKFTTYLYSGVVMECLTQKKFNNQNARQAPQNLRIYENIASCPESSSRMERIDMLDEVESCCEEPDLIYDRFYRNMSVREIAQNRGLSSEWIREKINRNLSKLRAKFSELGV